jgi:hypothetical protein
VSSGGARSLHVLRTPSAARAGSYSLELSNTASGKDVYAYQDLAVKPNTHYTVSAWVNARALRRPAADGRGLLIWDMQDGLVYTLRLTSRTDGWKRLSVTFRTRAYARDVQIRLYAPEGHVFWDAVRFARGDAARAVPPQVVPPTRPAFPKAVLDPGFEASSRAWASSGARSLRVLRRGLHARAGRHSLELSNSAVGKDAYVFQDLALRPNTEYSVSAWVNARAMHRPAAGGRGLLIWDAQDGLVYTVPLASRTEGWRRLSFKFQTRAHARDVQIRLYAPEGRVLWDAVRVAARGPVEVSSTGSRQAAASQAAGAMALATTGGGTGDAAGEASNAYRVTEAQALWGYIKKRPIYGYGFGKVASDFAAGYSYELSYLDLLLKAGIVGLLVYLSFPLRLIVDALRLRRLRGHAVLAGARAVGNPGVVVGVVAGILVAGATNPYLFAAFGLVSILTMVAWLEDPFGFER